MNTFAYALQMKRIKKKMDLDHAIKAIDNDVPGLDKILFDISIKFSKKFPKPAQDFAIVTRLDAMEIYGKDIESLYKNICQADTRKFLIIVTVFEISRHWAGLGKTTPSFSNLDVIREYISDAQKGEDNVQYPFEDAKKYIQSHSTLEI